MSDMGKCDQEVYDHGKHIVSVWGGKAEDVERLVKMVRVCAPEGKVDWHYIAGVAIIRVIGNEERVRYVFGELLPALSPVMFQGWRFTSENDSIIPLSTLKTGIIPGEEADA